MADLGDRVRDTVTGYTGIVVARTEHLLSTPTVRVQGEVLVEGVPVREEAFEAQRVVVLEPRAFQAKARPVTSPVGFTTGGTAPQENAR